MSLINLWCKRCQDRIGNCQSSGCDNCPWCGTDTTREAAMGEAQEARDEYYSQQPINNSNGNLGT